MDIRWRDLTTLDLPVVADIAAAVHPAFHEDAQVLAERQRLYPDGARLLELDGMAAGYLLSHPWRLGTVPALNTPIGCLPADADTFYLHDLALLPAARGTGAAAHLVDAITRHARLMGYPTMSLVAVNGSAPFWTRHGFVSAASEALERTLRSYEDTARFMIREL